MLVDWQAIKGNLVLSYINNEGELKMKYFKWDNPMKYVSCGDDDKDKSGKYTSWDGRAIKEVYTSRPDRYSMYNFLETLPPSELEEVFAYNEPNIFFVDLENQILNEKINPVAANGEIQTISIVNKDKVLVIGTKKFSTKYYESMENDINNYFAKFKTNYKFKYKFYESEYDMMLNFMTVYIPKMPVVSGWNSNRYDWCYIVNRCRKLGISPELSSPTKLLRASYKEDDPVELPAHRVIIDYMELYEKYDTSVKVKESSSLDFVSENLLGVKKVNYQGNLTHLYENDYYKFVMYNAIDSILVQQIHLKMKYIDILYGISTLSKCRIIDSVSTLPVTEGILRDKMKNEKNIQFVKVDRKDTEDELSVKGGWVKDPIVGMSKWVVCQDFSSLYPTTMREFNISADSFKGALIVDKGKTVLDMIGKLRSGERVYSSFNGHKIELEMNDIICLNGSVFKNENGVVTQVMESIYAERKKFKKMMMKSNEELKDLQDEYDMLKKQLG